MSEAAVANQRLDVTFRAEETTPGQVRTLLGFCLDEWSLSSMTDDVCLIASELITNAVSCVPGRALRVKCTRKPDSVLLAVWDPSDAMPLGKPPEELCLEDITPDAKALDPGYEGGTGGRGLPIVEALSSEWGVTKTDPSGKWVWARIPQTGENT
ncbi:ATP-binding protein [Actinomadura macra]|uniref:ATP-binding protein n=1 Tax=Actinomadura macra TaxID=46164 RepID=UPI000AB22AFD|nr:ATP-binding protein [Actinomadura macra]